MARVMKLALLALLSLTWLAWSVSAQPGAKGGPKFEVRLAEDKPGKDLTEAKLEDRKIYLHKEVILSAKDIAAAKAITIGDKSALDVNFTPAGAKALKDVTAAQTGKRLAILLDGKVLVAPVIRSGITEGRAQITGDFTREESERIAKVLSGQ